MRLFGLGNGPYQTMSHGLANPSQELLSRARYQIVPSQRGAPAARLNLWFRRDIPSVTNPDMTLAVLLDRSGSMSEAFAEGHVYNVTQAILRHVAVTNAGYDLVFYDDRVSDAGHISNDGALRNAIAMNGPRGGTYVSAALRHTIQSYKKRAGLYVIVITDGEFADKANVLQLVTQELLPQITPENPYAFRLHFVGAGEGVDHAFLRQIEDAATGQGAKLVTAHHHPHLSHSHADILEELDKAYMGVGLSATVGEIDVDRADSDERVISAVMDVPTKRVWTSGVAPIGFLPVRPSLTSSILRRTPHRSRFRSPFVTRTACGKRIRSSRRFPFPSRKPRPARRRPPHQAVAEGCSAACTCPGTVLPKMTPSATPSGPAGSSWRS